MGRKRKLVQYLSCSSGKKTGMVSTPYKDENGKLHRKSYSWHYAHGRSEAEAIQLLLDFIKENGIS